MWEEEAQLLLLLLFFLLHYPSQRRRSPGLGQYPTCFRGVRDAASDAALVCFSAGGLFQASSARLRSPDA